MANQTPLEVFESVCLNPCQRARASAAQGVRVAGYLCTYTPEELLHAAGYLPFRLYGRNEGATHRADAHLQRFACGFLRSVLDMALSGELDFLRLVVFSHTCDTMQNLAEIWKHAVPNIPSLIITAPVKTDGEAAALYFAEEIRRTKLALEKNAGTISDDRLNDSIALYDRHRALLLRLYEARRARPGVLSARQMMAAALSAALIPREEHLPLIERLVAEVEAGHAAEPNDLPKVLVVGNTCQNIEYFSVIEGAGCVLVEDDLCSGQRAFAMTPSSGGDPCLSLARSYLARTSCPTKRTSDRDPGKDLLERARKTCADGVLFLTTAFCEPWGFDYPCLKRALDVENIPSLQVSIECNNPPAEAFRGRVQAFVEVLQARI